MSIANKALNKYLNPVFVETGTYYGEGVSAAIEAGFNKIISIEVSKSICESSQEKFKDFKNVQIFNGDSTKSLWGLIENIDERITFLLDAHNLSWSDDTKNRKDLVEFPIEHELKIISKHPRKDHTILIDDVRLFKSHFKTSVECISKLLLSINPEYNISFEAGIVMYGKIKEDEVMVAQVIK